VAWDVFGEPAGLGIVQGRRGKQMGFHVRSRLVDDSGVAGGVFASGFFVALCLCVKWFWLRPDFGPSRASVRLSSPKSGSSDELSRAEAALGENCVNRAGFGPERPRNRQKTDTSGVDRGLVLHHESTESPEPCKKKNACSGVFLVGREVVTGSRRVPMGEGGRRGIREVQRGRKVVGE
jgi:hypothetical protein